MSKPSPFTGTRPNLMWKKNRWTTHRTKNTSGQLRQQCDVVGRVDNYTHSKTWLELNVEDVAQATQHLAKGKDSCDGFEQLPENMHWIMDPAGTVFIVKEGE